MSSTIDLESRPFAHASRGARRLVQYTSSALALTVLLIAYCELCSVVSGLPPPGLRISGPWALQVSIPWVIVGMATGAFGPRIIASRAARTYPRALIGIVVVCLAIFVLLFEALLAELRGADVPLATFLYQRAPVDLAAGALLVATYLGHRFWTLRDHSSRQTPAAAPPTDESIEVMTGTGRTRVRVAEIECLQADRNYINVIHVSGRTYLLRQTMAAAERSLEPHSFLRIHRSTIVNPRMIRERRPGGVLVLESGRTVNVSRAYRSRLADR